MDDKEEKIEYPPFNCDNIHYDSKEIDGYNKIFNFVISCREPGKSTQMWKKVYDAFRKEGRPSIIVKRLVVDVTDQLINDITTLFEKFTGIHFEFKYSKVEIKQGMLDVKLNGKLFIRFVALSAPMSRLKSMVVRNVKYIMFDEFICNLRLGEKYLKDEPMRIKELYTTYNRETEDHRLKVYFFGNPYSLFNPYFSWLNVDTRKLKIGTITIGDKDGDQYAIQLYKMKDELREFILKNNPLYQFDDSYTRYGFEGIAIQDTYIRIVNNQPRGFSLTYVFKLNNKFVGVYEGYDEEQSLFYWCRVFDINEYNSKRREVMTFDFGQMEDNTMLLDNAMYKKKLYYFKDSIAHRQVAFQSIEASYFIEEIYQNI